MTLLVATFTGAVITTVVRNLFFYPTYNPLSYFLVFLVNFACFNGAALVYLVLYPYVSPFRHLPTAPQKPVYKRFFQDFKGWDTIPWVDAVPNNGLMRAFSLLNQEVLVVTSPEAVREVLITTANAWIKPPANGAMLRLLIGDGLLSAEGESHKRQRKALQPAFNYRHILDLHPLFWSKTCELLAAIAEEIAASGNNVVDIQDWVSRATLDIISMGGFGVDFHAIANPESSFLRVYRKMFSPRPDSQTGPLLVALLPTWLITRLPIERVKEILRAIDAIRQMICEFLIANRAKEMENPEKVPQGKGILEVVMRSNKLTERELIDHSMTTIAAGHDTIGFALTAALMELSLDQDLQARLRQEIRSHLPSPHHAETIKPADIGALPLLDAICNETFRYYPSVHVIGRMLAADGITIAGQKIPKGTNIAIPTALINHHQAYWSNSRYPANEFHPERWIKDENDTAVDSTGGATDSCSFTTFSRGPRICIGERFARCEMAVVLAGLVGRFQIVFQGASGKGKSMEELYIRHGITSHIIGGFWVTITEVEGW
jgi:cytochrome P450